MSHLLFDGLELASPFEEGESRGQPRTRQTSGPSRLPATFIYDIVIS